jgi:glucokinase
MLLAGDIGGTKTNLAIYSPDQGPRMPLVEATFPSDDYPSLQAIAQEFLSRTQYQVKWASFGVAGPVVDGHVKTTNLPWEMDETELRQALKLESVFLLNDLESVANAIPRLELEDIYTLNQGYRVEHGAIAVIAPGTGLGEGFLTWDGTHYRAYPSEGGHTDFGPSNETEIALLRYLMKRYEHVSYEWVCSGMGIPNIYDFFKANGHAAEPEWLREKLAVADDPTPIIVNAALQDDKGCELCEATLNTFVSVLGAEAGNLALKLLATGGVYLGGGIPPRILPALRDGRFMKAYLRKGRFANLLERMPVHVILNAKAGLLGAAGYGLAQVENS